METDRIVQCPKCASEINSNTWYLEVSFYRDVITTNRKSVRHEILFVKIPLCFRCYIKESEMIKKCLLFSLYGILLFSIFLSFYHKESLEKILALFIFIFGATTFFWTPIIFSDYFIKNPLPSYVPDDFYTFIKKKGYSLSKKKGSVLLLDPQSEDYMERKQVIKQINEVFHYEAR